MLRLAALASLALAGCAAAPCPPASPPSWDACAADPELEGCGFVEAAVTPAPGAPAITCVGLELVDAPHDPCVGWPGELVGGGFDGRSYARRFHPNHRFGTRFDLEVRIDPATGEGTARLCRVRFGDVAPPAGTCPLSDWTCATEGTVTIDRWSSEPDAAELHGELHVSFEDGATVDAVY
jgi:hypothetical protein